MEFHWDFIGKLEYIFHVGKSILYLGNVFPNIGKLCGKSLGHVWDFSGRLFTILTLGNQCNMLGTFFPMLENIVGNCWDFFGIFSREQILVSSWETNFSFWVFYPNIGKYCGNHWELIGIFRQINTVTVFLLENIQYHTNRFSTFLTLVCFFDPPCIYFCQTARFLKRYQ